MKILNLEQFLKDRGLNYKVVVGPRWENDDAKGSASDDEFYIINSALKQIKKTDKVWNRKKFSLTVINILKEHDIHETTMIYTHDLDEAKKTIFAQGQKAYNAYVIRQKRSHGDDVKTDSESSSFKKLVTKYGG